MSQVWCNGGLYPADFPVLNADERGFLFGDGVFRTLKVENGAPIWLDVHLARLEEDAKILGIALPYTPAQIALAAREVLRADTPAAQHGRLRLSLTRGCGALPAARPQSATLLITARAQPAPKTWLSLITAPQRRTLRPPLSAIKSLNYLESLLAQRAAQAAGVDSAVLLTPEGRVSEAAMATLCIIKGKQLLTPRLVDGALRGVTRDWVLSHAAQAGLKAQECALRPRDLFGADAVFLANSVQGLVLATTLDGKKLQQRAAPLLDKLRTLLDNAQSGG